MSLGLSRLSHLGFEVDLLYFFNGVLTVELMKIKLWLVIVGGFFSYCLIILRSNLDPHVPRSNHHGLQDRDHHHVVIEFGSHSQSQGSRISPSTAQEADSPPQDEDQGFLGTQSQQGHNDSSIDNNGIVAQFIGCIERLKKENGNLILAILKHVDEYLRADFVTKNKNIQLAQDDNLVMDSLPSRIINELGESTRLMMTAGLEEECLEMYCSCRKKFVSEIIWALKEVKMEDIDKVAKIRPAIKALWVANRIVFPNERRLFERVFEGFVNRDEVYPALPGIDALELRKNYLLLGINAFRLWKSIGIETPMDRVNQSRFEDLLYLTYGVNEQAIVSSGRIHHITIDVLDYIWMICKNSQGLFELSKLSLDEHIAMIIDLLDGSLEAISKNYDDPTLGYLFIINNRMFIERNAAWRGLRPMFGDDWLKINTTKFQQNLELYQRSSWGKILDILKQDINESDPNVVELMKDKLRSFYEHLDDICHTQATWFVYNKELREQIIKSIEKVLLPAYGNFISRLQDFLGNQAYRYIKHGMFDIQTRLNNLFLVRK